MTRQKPGPQTRYPVYDELCQLVWSIKNAVWTFVTHERPHLDEIFAIWLVIRFGVLANRFKVRTNDPLAGIQFWNQGGKTPDGRTWQQHAREHKILLGCAPGSDFDPDHEQFGVKARKDLCVASAMHEFLALEDEAVNEILAAIVDNDIHGRKHPMGLGILIQSLYHAGYDAKVVIYWAMDALDALYNQRRRKLSAPKVDGRANLVFPGTGVDRETELAALWLLRTYQPQLCEEHSIVDLIKIKSAGKSNRGEPWTAFPLAQAVAGYHAANNPSVLDWTLRFLGKQKYTPAKSLRRDIEALHGGEFDPITSVLNLTSVIEAFGATWARYQVMVDWSFAAFEARFKSSQQYIFALSDVERAVEQGGVTMVDWEGTPVKVLALTSDNRQIIGAAWKTDADVLVVRRRSGHISIFFNKSTVGERPASLALSIGDIIAEIRGRELTLKGLPVPETAILRSPGSLPNLLEWYYHPEMQALLNGADAASGVDKTRVSFDKMVEIVISKMNKPAL